MQEGLRNGLLQQGLEKALCVDLIPNRCETPEPRSSAMCPGDRSCKRGM